MIRVYVICEGQTEEMFIAEVLSDIFNSKEIYLIPSLIGKPGHKGGNVKYERLFTDLRARLLSDTSAYCTTFFDFYGLSSDFPGKDNALKINGTANKADCVQQAFTERLCMQLGEAPVRRFIPYVQMYEFKGLLFSNPLKLAQAIYQPALANDFQNIRDDFDSPEDINNSYDTAPSRLIEKRFIGYDKPLHGSLAAIVIGIEAMRVECPLFDGWLKRIEALQGGVG